MINQSNKKQRLPNTTTSFIFQQPSTSANTQGTSHSLDKDKHEKTNDSLETNKSRWKVLIDELDQIKQCRTMIPYQRTSLYAKPDRKTLDTRRRTRRLPRDIISTIINYLPQRQRQATLYQCTLVNKQFYSIANPLLWQHLQFSQPKAMHDSVNLQRFFRCISYLPPRRLDILGQHIHIMSLLDTHWTDSHLLLLLPHIPNLHYLTIHKRTHITDKSFQSVPSQCPQLVSLHLIEAHLLQPESISHIGHYCTRLKSLEWYLTPQQSPKWLSLLIPQRHPPLPLERLKFWFDSKSWHQGMFLVLKMFKRLTSLDITAFAHNGLFDVLLVWATHEDENNYDTIYFDNTKKKKPPTGTTTVIKKPWWPGLKRLVLYACDNLEDATLIGFIKTHPQLEVIELLHADRLTDASLHGLRVYLPHLQHVVLGCNARLSYECVRRLARESKTLKSICINFDRTTGSTLDRPLIGPDSIWYSGDLDLDAINQIRNRGWKRRKTQ